MITWMQKHRKYLVVTIWISTIAFVGAGFVGWGAYSMSGNKADTVAKVGDRVISGKELQSSYNNVYGYYNQMFGGRLTQEKAQQMHLQDIALNQLVQQSLLLNYADELGITATQEEILEKIQNIDSFKKDGVFNKERYFQALQAVNKKAKEFESEVKKEIVINKLNKALKMPHTDLELKTVGAALYLEDKLKAKLVDIQNSEIKIDDKELKTFWESHKTDYMSDKSYTIESIKVSSETIEVDDKELEEFYNDNKQMFRGDDDKILSFEKAKDKVKAKLQLKKAKKETLKKYLALKDGKIKADEKKTLTSKDSDIPLAKIATLKVGSYAKAIELKDGFMTAKLIAINEPKPLSFEDAKKSVHDALFKEKKAKLLEERAKEESKTLKDAKTLEFLSREDAKKVTMLSENEARAFLNHLFKQKDKKGYYLFSDKAIAYEIIDQRFNQDQNKTEMELLVKNIEAIKSSTTQNRLIKRLESKYKIEKQ